MAWNYRIITVAAPGYEDHYGLSEVYYDEEEEVVGYTDPLFGLYESPAELVSALRLMLKDAEKFDVLGKDDLEAFEFARKQLTGTP